MGFFDFFKKNKIKLNEPEEKEHSEVFQNKSEIKNNTKLIVNGEEIIPVEVYLEKAIPSQEGLYPHEILLLDYAHTYMTDNQRFQGFWLYHYGVTKPEDVLKSLLTRGFLELGDIKNILENKTIPVLKEELKKQGLKTTGKKADIIKRLLKEGNREELELSFSERMYRLTTKGQDELDKNAYVPYIHRHPNYGLDIWSLNILVNQHPKNLYMDKIWNHFNEQSNYYYSKHEFGLYRNVRLNMYEILIEENKTDKAFQFLAEVIYFDLSGLDNSYDYIFNSDLDDDYFDGKSRMEFFIEGLYPYEKSLNKLPPGIIDRLAFIIEELGISEDNLNQELSSRFKKFKFPFHMFTQEECIEICIAELNGDIKSLVSLYNIVGKRLKTNLKRK
ncbi:MAG: SAP domain-containing protein [Dehalobacter sp.]|nr:SAP domain-containing protein [Dehalobacter sp.]